MKSINQNVKRRKWIKLKNTHVFYVFVFCYKLNNKVKKATNFLIIKNNPKIYQLRKSFCISCDCDQEKIG